MINVLILCLNIYVPSPHLLFSQNSTTATHSTSTYHGSIPNQQTPGHPEQHGSCYNLSTQVWPHHTSTPVTPLAQNQTAHWLQSHLTYLHSTPDWPTYLPSESAHSPIFSINTFWISRHPGTPICTKAQDIWPIISIPGSCHLEHTTCSPPSTCITFIHPATIQPQYSCSTTKTVPVPAQDSPLQTILPSINSLLSPLSSSFFDLACAQHTYQ